MAARPVPASILAILGQRRIEDIVAAMAAIHDLGLARDILKAEASGAGRPAVIGVINCRLDEITEAGDAQQALPIGKSPEEWEVFGFACMEERDKANLELEAIRAELAKMTAESKRARKAEGAALAKASEAEREVADLQEKFDKTRAKLEAVTSDLEVTRSELSSASLRVGELAADLAAAVCRAPDTSPGEVTAWEDTATGRRLVHRVTRVVVEEVVEAEIVTDGNGYTWKAAGEEGRASTLRKAEAFVNLALAGPDEDPEQG
jgi:hypothetical protein